MYFTHENYIDEIGDMGSFKNEFISEWIWNNVKQLENCSRVPIMIEQIKMLQEDIQKEKQTYEMIDALGIINGLLKYMEEKNLEYILYHEWW